MPPNELWRGHGRRAPDDAAARALDTAEPGREMGAAEKQARLLDATENDSARKTLVTASAATPSARSSSGSRPPSGSPASTSGVPSRSRIAYAPIRHRVSLPTNSAGDRDRTSPHAAAGTRPGTSGPRRGSACRRAQRPRSADGEAPAALVHRARCYGLGARTLPPASTFTPSSWSRWRTRYWKAAQGPASISIRR